MPTAGAEPPTPAGGRQSAAAVDALFSLPDGLSRLVRTGMDITAGAPSTPPDWTAD
jgi:hypothetical protein